MYPFISIGMFAIPTKAFIYLISAWLGLTLLEKSAERLDQDRATLYSLATNALFIGIIGARVVFVALHWSSYAANWISIFWPLNVGYNVWGGLFIGGAYFFFMMRAKQLDFGHTADAATPLLLIFLFAIFLADYLAGPGYGVASQWRTVPFHPVQIYELVVVLFGSGVWWMAHQKRPFAGSAFLLTTAVVAFGLLLTTPFRGNTWVTESGLHVAQIVYLIITLLCLFTLMRLMPPAAPNEKGEGEGRREK